ncbi:MAG: phosphomannomutase/phosphoglucomutase [Kiritimatiellae bacterium]|nr:phosphomannomutase/phosphoglucomutase [Kiritimatiellia bacterium]
MTAFKAYDIRGIYGTELTDDLAYQVGRCLPAMLGATSILVGRDARTSSPALRDALVRGLTEAGADVTDMGLATTPMVYFFTAAKGFGGSVMITASHNPPEYNGLKVSKAEARPCGYHLGLSDVEAQIVSGNLPPAAATPGTVTQADYRAEYTAWLNTFRGDISGLNYAVDCSDGAAGLIAEDLFDSAAVLLNAKPDGTFPHHGPNPLEMENCEQLIAAVKQNALDVGLIFDGDADRVMCVDEQGEFVPPDALIPLFAQWLREHFPVEGMAPVVVHDIRTSRGVMENLRETGFDPLMVRVGAAFAKTALREQNGLCGGEVAGHYYFRHFYWCDSGELAARFLLAIVADAKRKGQTFSQILAPILNRYKRSGEVNVHGVTDRAAAIARVETAVVALMGAPLQRADFDGIRLDWADAWFGVRASNTEPILRLAGETRTQERLDALLAAAKSAI